MSQSRILVVDDEESIRDFVKIALEFEGYLVEEASTGEQGLQRFQSLRPALVILDWMLPDLEGIEVCRRIRGVSQTPILLLTARTELEDRVLGLDSGADDYLCKPFKMKELQARVRALLRRSGADIGNILTFGEIRLDVSTRAVTRAIQAVDLTAREFELLELFLRNPRRVLTREAVMSQLWGWQDDGSQNALEAHISALRRKLGDAERQLIRTVRGVGYCLGG